MLLQQQAEKESYLSKLSELSEELLLGCLLGNDILYAAICFPPYLFPSQSGDHCVQFPFRTYNQSPTN